MTCNELNRQDAKNAKNEPDEDLDRLAHTVIGAAIEIHKALGPGFLETVSKESFYPSSSSSWRPWRLGGSICF